MDAPLLRSRRSRFAALLPAAAGAAFAAALLLAGSEAAAAPYDVLAAPCLENKLTCQRGPLSFERVNALPIEFNFDTGWVPANSPLQVHIWAAVYANTAVRLQGSLDTAWPDAFYLTTPGAAEGGDFSYHYGLDVGAQGKIEIEVAGQTYTWVGDLPYVPQIDFGVQDQKTFDAWGWDPGVTLSSTTDTVTLIQIGIADIVGGSIPGIDGGFELDVAMEVDARYRTNRIVVATTDGEPVAGGDITNEADATSTSYPGGPNIELDVHPEGSVKYDGTLHLIPAFYVELLGQTWSIPIADIPIGFPITEDEWVFDKQRVHVPVPDLAIEVTEIDFGEVEVGQKNLEPFPLFNAGEADVAATVISEDPENFEVFDPTVEVEPGITVDSAIRFVPKRNGEFATQILVGSNDPDAPVQVILVKGVGYGGPEAAPSPQISQDAGCDCRAAGRAPGGNGPGAWAAALGIAALAARRRRSR